MVNLKVQKIFSETRTVLAGDYTTSTNIDAIIRAPFDTPDSIKQENNNLFDGVMYVEKIAVNFRFSPDITLDRPSGSTHQVTGRTELTKSGIRLKEVNLAQGREVAFRFPDVTTDVTIDSLEEFYEFK